MDKFIPAPPATTDTVTWIAVALVCVLIVALVVGVPRLLAFAREERREMIAGADRRAAEQLAAFREELAAERITHRESVTGLHTRINCIAEDLTAIRAKVDA